MPPDHLLFLDAAGRHLADAVDALTLALNELHAKGRGEHINSIEAIGRCASSLIPMLAAQRNLFATPPMAVSTVPSAANDEQPLEVPDGRPPRRLHSTCDAHCWGPELSSRHSADCRLARLRNLTSEAVKATSGGSR